MSYHVMFPALLSAMNYRLAPVTHQILLCLGAAIQERGESFSDVNWDVVLDVLTLALETCQAASDSQV